LLFLLLRSFFHPYAFASSFTFAFFLRLFLSSFLLLLFMCIFFSLIFGMKDEGGLPTAGTRDPNPNPKLIYQQNPKILEKSRAFCFQFFPFKKVTGKLLGGKYGTSLLLPL
jgi:hypothetical protein